MFVIEGSVCKVESITLTLLRNRFFLSIVAETIECDGINADLLLR
jgi:hypothetical protein